MIEKYIMPDDPWACSEPAEVKRIYDEKLRIANLLKPESVLEIGVRAGYTAAMFLHAGAKKYIGLDATDSWGGTPGAVRHAQTILPKHFPQADIQIHNVNTQHVNTLENYGTVELVHVDGAHDYNGCLHDLELALTIKPKWILVDDILHHPESCKLSVETFIGRYRFKHIYLATLRGDCLIQVGD